MDTDGGKQQKVCLHWTQGRCSRYPCPFLHTELPDQGGGGGGGGGMPRSGNIYFNSKINAWQSTSPWRQQVSTSGPSVQKKEKLCKKWLQGSCKYGGNCKYLHKGPTGDRFSLQATLREQPQVVTGIAFPSGSDKLYTERKGEAVRISDCQSGQVITGIALPSGSDKLYTERKGEAARISDCQSGQVVSGIALPSGSDKLYTERKGEAARISDCQSGQVVSGIALPSGSDKLYIERKGEAARISDCQSGQVITGIVLPSGSDKLYTERKGEAARISDCQSGQVVSGIALPSGSDKLYTERKGEAARISDYQSGQVITGIALPSGSDKLYTERKGEAARILDCQSGQVITGIALPSGSDKLYTERKGEAARISDCQSGQVITGIALPSESDKLYTERKGEAARISDCQSGQVITRIALPSESDKLYTERKGEAARISDCQSGQVITGIALPSGSDKLYTERKGEAARISDCQSGQVITRIALPSESDKLYTERKGEAARISDYQSGQVITGIALPSGSDKLYTERKGEAARISDCQSGQTEKDNAQSQTHTQQGSNRLVVGDIERLQHVVVEQIHTQTQGPHAGTIKTEATTENKVVNSKKRKTLTARSRSIDLHGFTELMVEEGDPPIKKRKIKCDTCSILISADSGLNDTTSLKNHKSMCNLRHEPKLNLQWTSGGTGIGALSNWKFDQLACRMALCVMIILDELPFRFVEQDGFKRLVEQLCPQFDIPSRHTIRADCVKLFLEHKITMKTFFQKKGMGRVSITTCCWTAINNTNFICVTAHCIDKDWVLHKKIISFRTIYGHKRDDLGAAIICSLEEWELKKILCCTMDNASANDGCINYMKPVLEEWNTSILGGKFLHMRCVAHILNLVVNDELNEIGCSVRRVRETVKWIKASPDRSEEFKSTARALNNKSTKYLCLDVPTRWDSTYLMLESVQSYTDVIKHFGRWNEFFSNDLNQTKYNDLSIRVLEEQDWDNIKRMVAYLEKFYNLALLVSDTTYATLHTFFKEMCDVFELISHLELNENEEISNMAMKMKMKLEKYWLETNDLNPRMNKIIYIAALLDPRQKMKHVEMCLRTIYGDERGAVLVAEVNKSFHELFEFYHKQMISTLPPRSNVCTVQREHTLGRLDRRRPRGQGSCSRLQVITEEHLDASTTDMSEINFYFTEKQYMMTLEEVESFDVLKWWMNYGMRFPVISEMARDVLAIPISSVPYESAFSTGGPVLSQFRSSLTPNLVEALICAEDWLRSSSSDIFLNDEEDVAETEFLI